MASVTAWSVPGRCHRDIHEMSDGEVETGRSTIGFGTQSSFSALAHVSSSVPWLVRMVDGVFLKAAIASNLIRS